MLELLPIDEQQELAHCEAVIERGLETFFEVGQAMAIIRDRKLYRSDFKTFEEYCRDRWGMRRQVANRFIASSETVANLEPIGSIPASESQARPLTSLEPDQQRKAWSKVVQEAQASGKPITAAKVRAVVDTFKSTSQPYQEQRKQRRLAQLENKTNGTPIPDDQQQRLNDLTQGKTVVLNIHKDLHLLKYAMDNGLYVRCDGVSEWANPFVANVDGSYDEVCNLYAEKYLPYKKELLSRIHELKGKALGAHCYPEKCHCEVLREWAEKGVGRGVTYGILPDIGMHLVV